MKKIIRMSKKYLEVALCAILVSVVFCTGMESHATEKVDMFFGDTLDENDYTLENAQLVDLGKQISNNRVLQSTELAVPRKAQQGEAWSNDIMQTEGKTIGQAGCYLTSFTMVQLYYGGIYNPRGVNNRLGNYACPFYREVAASYFGYTISGYKTSGLTDTYVVDYIQGSIAANVPVIIGFTKPDGGNHFVVAKGYIGSSIIIVDPGPQNYTTITQYKNLGYTVTSLIRFTK